MGETGRLPDWKDCCYYYCYGRESEMEGGGLSQGLDIRGGCRRIGVPVPCGAA